MKKYFFLILIFFSSCGKDYKYHSMIEKELNKTIPEFKTYESIEFSGIQNDSSLFLNEPDYLNLYDSMINYSNKMIVYKRLEKEYKEKEMYSESVYCLLKSDFFDSCSSNYLQKIKTYQKEYQPKIIGHKIKHIFRANENGKIKIFKREFHFTENMDSIKNSTTY